MAFRSVVINERCKLEYSLNYLVCRKGMTDTKILIDEIKVLLINSTQVSITTSLITELSKKKVKLIICDEVHNPECEMVSYQNTFYSYRKIKEQLNSLSDNFRNILWKEIIKEKIINQARNLKYMKMEKQYNQLIKYSEEIENGDISNREGHSSKLYFNALFGKDFTRKTENKINRYLNYGYTILLSTINREIKMAGYLTELGIHHIGDSNSFNLSCDFIEPIRPLIDYYVISDKLNEDNYKTVLVELLALNVKYNNMSIFLDNAIHLYVNDLINILKSKEIEKIKFIQYEL